MTWLSSSSQVSTEPRALVEVAPALVEEQRVVRRVELEVGRAEAGELLDLLAQDRGDVPEEVLERRVRAGRALRVPELREQAGARAASPSARGRCAGCAYASSWAERKRRRRSGATSTASGGRSRSRSPTTSLFQLAPEEGVEVPVAEAVDRLDHLALEREAAHLAVRDDVEPGLGLAAERLVDGRVLGVRGSRRDLPPARGLRAARPGGAGCRRRPSERRSRCASRARPGPIGRRASRFEIPKAPTIAPARARPAETSIATRKASIEAERRTASCWSRASGTPRSPPFDVVDEQRRRARARRR